MGYQKITHSVNVYRLTRTGDNEEYSGVATYSNVECCILPASTDIIAVYPSENAFALYEILIYENVALQNGDKLSQEGEEWIVRGVPQRFNLNQLFYTRVIGEKKVGT